MRVVEFDLPMLGKCTVKVRTEGLAAYIKRQLLNYYVKEYIENGSDSIRSEIEFFNNEILATFNRYRELGVSLSRSDKWNGNQITVDEYKYVINEKTVSIIVKQKKGIKNKIKKIYHLLENVSELKKYAFWGGEFYQSVLFPILSVYAACYGMYSVHGSLVKLKNGSSIIISGLDGVGKSSLAEMICSHEDNELLADNIVLFNGEKGLNLLLVMRLMSDYETDQEVIYRNSEIIEILPKKISIGLSKVETIFNLMIGNNSSDVSVNKSHIPASNWIMYMERAPEIGQANRIMSFWVYMYNLVFSSQELNTEIINISIPKGKLKDAKEIIEEWA